MIKKNSSQFKPKLTGQSIICFIIFGLMFGYTSSVFADKEAYSIPFGFEYGDRISHVELVGESVVPDNYSECGTDDYASPSISPSFFFEDDNVDVEATIELHGDGQMDYASAFPYYPTWYKSYSQTIYTAAEMHEAGAQASGGTITKIRYLPSMTESIEADKEWTVYIGSTSMQGFPEVSDWILPDEMTEVFSGEVETSTTADEWFEVTLTTPFEWDGSSNIVVAVNVTSPGYGVDPMWKGYTQYPPDFSYKGLYATSYNQDIDSSSPTDNSQPGGLNTVAQIQFVGSLQPACSVTPDAGTLPAEVNVCPGQPFMLNAQDAGQGQAGLSGQWQQKLPNETSWVDIENATTNPYTVLEAPSDPMEYRYVLSCGSDQGITNSTTTTFMSAEECLCTPLTNYGCFNGNDISKVTMVGESEALYNDSGCGTSGFMDFTDLPPVDMIAGNTYELNVFSDYYLPGDQDIKAWIDFNQNGSFETSEEIANTAGNGLSPTGMDTYEFTVPEDTEPGIYRLRIRLVAFSPDFTACSDEVYGETEDYLVEVIHLEDCFEADAGIAEANFNVCASNPFTLSVSGSSAPAIGLDRIWQSSPQGAANWTDIEGATGSIYIMDGINEPTDFRYKVECTLIDGEATYSDIIEININPAEECYCIPVIMYGCGYDHISHVTLEGETHTLDNESECIDDGYGDYTELTPADLLAGETYTLEITSGGYGPGNDVRVWIDYNNNGTFEASEEIANTNGYGLDFQATPFEFTVPEDVAPGDYRMRVKLEYSTASIDPCAGADSGEVEDYTVNIISTEIPCEAEDVPYVVLDSDNITPPDLPECTSSQAINGNDWATLEFNDLGLNTVLSHAGSATESNVWFYTKAVNLETNTEYVISYDYVALSEDSENLKVAFGSAAEEVAMNETLADHIDIDLNLNTNAVRFSVDEAGEYYFGFNAYSTGDGLLLVANIHIDIYEDPYCQPIFAEGCESNTVINDFVLNGENDTSIEDLDTGCSDSGYDNKFDIIPPVDLAIGYSYDANITSGGDQDHAAIWIDYENGDESLFELVGFGAISGAQNTGINIQISTNSDHIGVHRMRVMVGDSDNPADFHPCEGPAKGEAHDYSVNIVPTPLCSYANAGSPTVSEIEVCPDTPFMIEVIGASTQEDGLIGYWEVNYGIDWIAFLDEDQDIITSTSYEVPGITQDTDFRYTITCIHDNSSHTSDEISVTLKPSIECYCIPEYVDDCTESYISNISILNENQDVLMTNETECSETGYADYTGSVTPAELLSESTYTLSIAINSSTPENNNVRAWIDYNLNGIFEMEEEIATTAGEGMIDGLSNFSFTIPEDVTGTFRMRVRLVQDGAGTIEACSGEGVGETEDYNIEVSIPSDVASRDFEEFSFYPNPVKDELSLVSGEVIEKVEVYNLLGQKVIEITPYSKEFKLNMNRLGSNMYLVTVTINGNQNTFKVIKN